MDRRRLDCIDPSLSGSKQPYHFVREMALTAAEAYLARCRETADCLAVSALADAIRELTGRGCRVVGAAIVEGAGRPLPGLAAILASHALIHTAEGEFFRAAFRSACGAAGIAVTGVRERDLIPAPPRLSAAVDRLGRVLGPPWTQDQKIAALAACRILPGAVTAGATANSKPL